MATGRIAGRTLFLFTTTILAAAAIYSAADNTAYAQETERSFSFNIPAKPVRQAINEIGKITGLAVVFNETGAASVRGSAVRGSLTSSQAVASLLQGTGLSYKFTNSNTVTIFALQQGGAVSAPEGSVVLDTITVTGAGAMTTEGTGSYTTGKMSTATGLALSIKETPQSVSVVTNARIKDSGMTTVEDAISNTTGMTVTATGGERSGYSARGFSVDNIMVDGLPIGQDSDTIGSSTLAMYDRVEVVRGATGLLEGAGNPSASINLVRKRPTKDSQFSVSTAAGSWNNYQAMLDAGGALNEAKTIRGRMVTSLQDADTFTDDYKKNRQLYYGILEADLTESTTLALGGYYNKEKNPGADWNGLPTKPDGSFYDFSRSVRSSPSWTYWNKQNASVFGELKHELDNGWVMSFKGSYLDAKMDMLGASLYRPDPASDLLQYNIGAYDYHHKQSSFDANAQGEFDLFGRTHQLSVGANYRRNIHDDGPGGWPSEFPYQFDPTNWEQSIKVPKPELNYMWERTAKEVNYGAYTTARLSITDPLNVFIGGRLSWYDTETYFRSATYVEETTFDEKARLTPYLAVTYDLNENFTVYGSVTSIFKPQNYFAANGAQLKPVSGTNYETGIKGEFLDGQVNASLAVFQINQKNLPEQLRNMPCNNTFECYTAAGEVRSRGFEAEVSGLITEDWRVFAGYTYVEAKYVEDSTGGKAGDRYGRDKPQHMLTLSTVYTLPDQYNKWRVGASARVQSATEGTVIGYTNAKQNAYGVVDLMAGFSPSENTDFRLNIYNVFDKHYYKSVGYTDNANLLGAPRSFMLSGTYKFLMQPVGYIGVNSVQKLRFTHKGSLFLYAAVVVLQVIFFGAQHSFAASEAYPLNVSHMLGTTVLPREPERIITLGWSGEDAVLAFGKKPVAMTRYGSFPSGIFPWNEAKLAGEQPVLLSGDLNFEAIAALRPDLILGVYSGIDQIAYKRLSAIAPTIVYRSAPWGADWREQTEITGEALGRKAEAKQLITDTNIFLNKLGAQSPELKGKTFVFGTYFAGGNSVVVYLPKDPRVQALSELGLQPSVTVKALAHKNPEETSVSVSLEEIGTLDAEILIMWYGDGARAAAEAQPLFQRLEAVKRGSYVALDDPVSVWSTSALSVLSIPYGFPQFVPRLAEAARAAEIK